MSGQSLSNAAWSPRCPHARSRVVTLFAAIPMDLSEPPPGMASSAVVAIHRFVSGPPGIAGARTCQRRQAHTCAMTAWFARPVLHVTDVAASVRFYTDRLGFTTAWRHEEDGKLLVAQVDRQGCALILSCQWPDKVGK